MNGPPNINRADIARYFALLQPPSIAERLFNDASFRAEFGLPAREAISFGGPAIAKAQLYDAVRRAFADSARSLSRHRAGRRSTSSSTRAV